MDEIAIDYSEIHAEIKEVNPIIPLLSCVLMLVFIALRYYTDEFLNIGNSPIPNLEYVPRQAMVGVHNPFAVSLKGGGCRDGKYTASVSINSTVNSESRAYWGVPVNTLLKELNELGAGVFLDAFRNNRLYNSSIETSDIYIVEEDTTKDLELTCDEAVLASELGTSPRQRYPLVVVNAMVDTLGMDTNALVALVTLIHLQDTLCTLHSHVIAQYVITASGQVHTLQPLFVASEGNDGQDAADMHQSGGANTSSTYQSTTTPNDESQDLDSNERIQGLENSEVLLSNTIRHRHLPDWLDEDENKQTDSQSDQDCIICQNAPITRAILPCRHASVCCSCFTKLDRCPMCRGALESYFLIGIEGEEFSDENQPRDIDEMSGATWWERLNHKLNKFFGFT